MSLFDPDEGRRRRDEAMDAVDAAHPDRLRAQWLDVIHAVCQKFALFTTDDVVRVGISRGLAEPREGRVFGPWMKAASAQGWCRKTDKTSTTERVKLHRGICQIWASNIAQDAIVETCPHCRGLGLIERKRA